MRPTRRARSRSREHGGSWSGRSWGMAATEHPGSIGPGFRANSNRAGSTPATDWMNLPAALELAVGAAPRCRDRKSSRPAGEPDPRRARHSAFFRPSVPTRNPIAANRRPDNGGVYRHELTAAEHEELLVEIKKLQGLVVICGYPSALYDDALEGWRRVERVALADGALPRIEVIWINPAATMALDRETRARLAGPLFSEGEHRDEPSVLVAIGDCGTGHQPGPEARSLPAQLPAGRGTAHAVPGTETPGTHPTGHRRHRDA
jgi:hypothetical protein